MYYIFLLGVITKFLSFLFIFAAYKTYKLPPQNKTSLENGVNANGNANSYDLKNFAESSCEEMSVDDVDEEKSVAT